MKRLFLVTFLCVCANAYPQDDVSSFKDKKNNALIFPIDSGTKLITYLEIVYLKDSISESELFSRAKSTFAKIRKNSLLILNEDKVAGIVLGEGTIQEFVTFMGQPRDAGKVNFTLTIACKEGRYRYVLTNLVLHEDANTSINLEQIKVPPDLSVSQWKELKNNINGKMRDLIVAVKAEMNKPSAKYDNW
jgi:hypothetical protein